MTDGVVRSKRREYYLNNKEKTSEKQKQYYQKNKEMIRNKCKSIPIERKRKWGQTEKTKAYKKSYKQRPEVKLRLAKRAKERYHEDIHYKITNLFRNRLYQAIKGIKKAPSLELLGCDINFFIKYIENIFLPTMTWYNYGAEWHLDHIIPCSSFDLTDIDQQKKCFHYTNLQPLFATTKVIDGIEYLGNLNKHDLIFEDFYKQAA